MHLLIQRLLRARAAYIDHLREYLLGELGVLEHLADACLLELAGHCARQRALWLHEYRAVWACAVAHRQALHRGWQQVGGQGGQQRLLAGKCQHGSAHASCATLRLRATGSASRASSSTTRPPG